MLGEAGGEFAGHPEGVGGPAGFGAQQAQRAERGADGGRVEAGVEDEGAGGGDQVPDHPFGAEHHAALRAERLGQGGGGDHVGLPGDAGGGAGPGPAGAEHAEAVRVVQHQGGAELAGGGEVFGEGCGVSVDREHRVGDHQGARQGAGGERRADGPRVAVRGPGDLALGEAAAVDQRGVVVGVGDDQGVRAGERGEHGQVGGVAGGDTRAAW